MTENPGLVGRQIECELLTGLLSGGRTGGRATVLVGDPGIGKSALLAEFGRWAQADGFAVLKAAGVEAEAQIPFAGLHQLAAPAWPWLTKLPKSHQDALLAAFGLQEGPPPNRVVIAQATVGLLEARAERDPVAVLVDDAHWLDPQTQEVLEFVARRVAGRPVVLLAATRSGHLGPLLRAGLPRLEVSALDDGSAAELLDRHTGNLTRPQRQRILLEARGNPLALVELPVSWRSGDGPLYEEQAPALSARLEQAFAGRIGGLPQATRDLLLIAAVDCSDQLGEILAAARLLGQGAVPEEALDPALRAGLLRTAGSRLEFRHPLVRSGILQAEPLTRRQAANAALAEALTDEPHRQTWHRAQSIVQPDDGVADQLEANVPLALARGAVSTAVRVLERSAQLTNDSTRRGHRYLLAAEHAFGLGRGDLVDRLVQAAAITDLTDLDAVRMQLLREVFDETAGDANRVFELCENAVRAGQVADDDLALSLLLSAGLRCWWADTGPAARARVVAVAGSRQDLQRDPRLIAARAVAEPVSQGRLVFDLLPGSAAGAGDDGDALRLLGMAAHAIGDEPRAADLLSRSGALLRQQGRLGLLPQVLSMEVQIRLELGDWGAARAAAAAGQQLAADTGQSIWSTRTLVCDARAHALRGDVAESLRLAAEAELTANQRRLNDLLACVQLARGTALLHASEWQDAYAALGRLFDPADPAYHQRERFAGLMLYAEAAVRAHHVAEARVVLSELEDVARTTPSPILHAHLLYARAALAEEARAGDRFAHAHQADLSRWPWIRGKLNLAHAEWLRSQGRHTEARAQVRSARRRMRQIGAESWLTT
jgi:hypothetical protein